jgi:hypothetical protein
MKQQFPQSPDLSHLKKQAKDLLRAFSTERPSAMERFGESLPSLRGLSPAQLAAQSLRLHDAHSSIAREYGFASWAYLASAIGDVDALRQQTQLDPSWMKREAARGIIYVHRSQAECI